MVTVSQPNFSTSLKRINEVANIVEGIFELRDSERKAKRSNK